MNALISICQVAAVDGPMVHIFDVARHWLWLPIALNRKNSIAFVSLASHNTISMRLVKILVIAKLLVQSKHRAPPSTPNLYYG